MYYTDYLWEDFNKEEVFALLEKYEIEHISLGELIDLDICSRKLKERNVTFTKRPLDKDIYIKVKSLNADFFKEEVPKLQTAYLHQLHIFFAKYYSNIENYECIIIELVKKEIISPNVIISCIKTMKTKKEEFIGVLLSDIVFLPIIIDSIYDDNVLKIKEEQNFKILNELISESYINDDLSYQVLDKNKQNVWHVSNGQKQTHCNTKIEREIPKIH